MMVSDDENDYVEIDDKALTTQLMQIAQQEVAKQDARQSTYVDLKVNHNAEKANQILKIDEKSETQGLSQAHSHSKVIKNKFKKGITVELNDLCLESHQKMQKPRKKPLR